MVDRFVAIAIVLLVAVAGGAGYLAGTTNLRTSTVTTTAVTIAGYTGLVTVLTNSSTTVTAISTTTVTALSAIATTTEAYDGVGLVLGLSANSSVAFGENLTIIVALTNELPYSLNATFSGFPYLPQGPTLSQPSAENFILPVPPFCGYTPKDYIPYFVVIYNQSGIPLQLNDVAPSILSCISVAGINHVFGPYQVITETIELAGFWKNSNVNQPWINATYNRFSPGTYSIVAFDPWNQLAETSFIVTPRTP